jgi:hypothetical protein
MDAMAGLPIGDYALLSDCRCAALVSRAGSAWAIARAQQRAASAGPEQRS